MKIDDGTLNLKRIFVFWLPLAATWLMMSVEGPFLASVIARLPEPTYNLAAHGVAYSFALIIEAPIIMIMSASAALVQDASSYLSLRRFTYFLNGVVTGVSILFVIPPVFDFIIIGLVGLPDNVASLVHTAVIILIPWPGSIGYRRFYNGVLIRNNLTRLVAYGTVIRISGMTLTALTLFLFTDVHGVVVGASALSAAVVFEAVASRIMADRTIKEIIAAGIDTSKSISFKEIWKFYYPLAITSVLGMGVQPFITFFLGQSRMAIESLAVVPVVNAFIFIFSSAGLSLQETVIALVGKKAQNYKQLKLFAALLAAFNVSVLGIIALTPLSDLWFSDVSGLGPKLSVLGADVLMMSFFLPALTIIICFQRGLLVHGRFTKPITYGTAIEFVGIISVLFLSVKIFDLIGAFAALLAFITGRTLAITYLFKPLSRLFKYG